MRLQGAFFMKTRAQKQDLAVALGEKVSRAKSIVLADYKGLTMQQLSELRDKLRDVDAQLVVTKNTTLQHAFPGAKDLPAESLQGPTITLLAYDDEISPIKLLVKALKDASIGKVKGGFLGTDVLDEAMINKLATLPTKDELRGKVVGVLAAPLQGMVGVLNGNLRNLVYALDQIRIKKGGV
jgi:large subunit ribosomal protein L10